MIGKIFNNRYKIIEKLGSGGTSIVYRGQDLLLNRMVTAYLEVAEIQAMNRTPMYMKDWVERLDGFLTMTGKNILTHAGSISHIMAIEKAHTEYDKYKERIKNEITKVEVDFVKQIESTAKKLKNKK